MVDKKVAGFREIEHTADWALEVWAESPGQLFEQAAAGMNCLMDLELQESGRSTREIQLHADDLGELLINFLNEILFWLEMDGWGVERTSVAIVGTDLECTAWGKPVKKISKPIKAATFHNLAVSTLDDLLTTTIVFDV